MAHTTIFKPTTSNGKPRCQEEIQYYIGNGPHWKQCDRPAVEGDCKCKIHTAAAKFAREQKSKALHDQKWNKRLFEIYGKKFYDALKEIEAGHNDPRSLAREVLAVIDKRGNE